MFEEIHARAADIVLTEQTINEFQRNRVATLSELGRNIQKSSSVNVYTTAVARELPGYSDWLQARDAVKKCTVEMMDELNDWIADSGRDPVFREFDALSASCHVLPLRPELIERAKTRKVLGRPPTSPDKYTVGDEVIWEALLDGVEDDLLIVSRDKTFAQNQSLLKLEFEGKKHRRLVDVTRRLSDAFEQTGKPAPRVKAAEQRLPMRLAEYENLSDGRCPVCNTHLDEVGYEGSDGDSTWWFACPGCGREFFPEAD